jgi:hypothetical protein
VSSARCGRIHDNPSPPGVAVVCKISSKLYLAAAAHAEFFPFVVESFGGFGATAAEFVQSFVRASIWRGAYEIVYGVSRDVAIAVQRGNALMASTALKV